MKKTTGLLLSLLFVAAFTTCKKDKPLGELMLGKWRVETLKMNGYANDVLVVDTTITYSSNEEEIEISGDRTGKHFSYGLVDATFDWILNGDKLTIDLGTSIEELEISVDGDTLVYKMILDIWVENAITYKIEAVYTAKRI